MLIITLGNVSFSGAICSCKYKNQSLSENVMREEVVSSQALVTWWIARLAGSQVCRLKETVV